MKRETLPIRLVSDDEADQPTSYKNLSWPDALAAYREACEEIISKYEDDAHDIIALILRKRTFKSFEQRELSSAFSDSTHLMRDKVREHKFLLFHAFGQYLDSIPLEAGRGTKEEDEYLAVQGELEDREDLTLIGVHSLLETIVKKSTYGPDIPSVTQRLKLLERFAKRHKGEGVAEYAKELFPELDLASREVAPFASPIDLPLEAPATWKLDKLHGETPPAFIKRVYAEWLGKGLDRAMLRSLDPSLGVGLDNWLRKHQWPDDIDLPTRGEQNRRLLEAGGETLASHLGKFTGAEAVREIDRLRNFAYRNR